MRNGERSRVGDADEKSSAPVNLKRLPWSEPFNNIASFHMLAYHDKIVLA